MHTVILTEEERNAILQAIVSTRYRSEQELLSETYAYPEEVREIRVPRLKEYIKHLNEISSKLSTSESLDAPLHNHRRPPARS